MKTFRITQIKNAIEPLFSIQFDKLLESNTTFVIGNSLYSNDGRHTVYYYEDLEYSAGSGMYFDGFINISTERIVLNYYGNSYHWLPQWFDNMKQAIDYIIEKLSNEIMKNKFTAVMRERKINSILND